MNKNPVSIAIQYRKVTLFIVAVLIFFGIYFYYITPKQEAPDFDATIAIITTVYPGAAPQDVEKLVTRKIEDKITEIEGYDYSESTSRNSVSIVVLRLEHDADINKAWNDLRQKMDEVQRELPEGCQPIDINTDVAETAGMIISISGQQYSYEELASYVEDFKDELSKIDGVSRFQLVGKQEKEIKVEIDAQKLNFHRLSFEDITQILNVQNVEIPSGSLDGGNIKINVKTSGVFSSLKEIENTIIDVSEATSAPVRLKDVARVYVGLEDSNFKIKHNGKNAVLLVGYFKSNKNIVLIGKEVEKKVEELKAKLPEDIVFNEILYQPRDVSRSVNDFIMNLLEGVLFVVLVVFVGMGIRNAVIVSTAIPLSILMTFSAMNVLGIKIHQISIAALIIALGMLVDNAIVISDAIQVRIDRGDERFDACVSGTREVAIPVLTSTLTTIAAFIPLLSLPSMAGEYIQSIPQIVILSLIASYLVALFVTPTMAYLFFKKSRLKEKKHVIRQFFDHMLTLGLKKKKSTVLIILLIIGGAAYITSLLGLQFFPKADKNIVYIDIKTEQSADISKTEEIADEISQILEEQEEVVSYTLAVGNGLPKFYNTVPPYTQSQDFAQIMVRVDLKKTGRFASNTEFVDYVQELMDHEVVGGTATIKQLEQGEPIGAPVRIRLTGKEMERLQKAAEKVKYELSQIPGTVNIDDNISEKTYEFYIDIDPDIATHFGISKYDVQKEVSIALRGKTASVFRQEGNEYNILVKSNITSKEELENMAIKSAVTGQKILLKQIAEVKLLPQLPAILKFDREMAVTVYSDVRSGFSSVKIQQILAERLKDMELEGVRVVFDGEKEKIAEHFGNIGTSSIIAVILVYVILMIQFYSFSQPIIILVTIPLSAIGSVVGLYTFRQPLSFTALLGIVSLLGIVVNNAIVLIDFINNERRQGKTVEEACKDAVDKRFRPIMLSTVTTVIGLIPLVVTGNELFRPMAISLMSGLMVATLLTLVVIPVVYSMVK